jgi:hypothetical protein
MPKKPLPPSKTDPTDWKHHGLWQRVCDAVRAIPDYFKTATNIEGMLATDIFTLNAALGATIEEQVVSTLNDLRPVWDPGKQYQTYSFVRQPQTFPDVVLRKKTDGHEILLGLELKGWYLLAKEGMPNFRFTVTPAACNPWDLVVVVPWALSNVLSGSPVVYSPFIELARYAAEQRNHYWQYERGAEGESSIKIATAARPYPDKADQIADRPAYDPGGNFGRLARYGIMGQYVQQMMQTKLCGISVKEWLQFFRTHAQE